MKMPGFVSSPAWRRYGAGIVMTILAAAVFAGAFVIKSLCWDTAVEKARYRFDVAVADKQQAVERAEKALAAEESAVRESLTGLDDARKASDDRLMSDIMSYVTTWSDSQTYRSQRDKLIAKYDWLNEDSAFLSMSGFFPPVSKYILRDASGALVMNQLDDGRNIRFGALTTHVMGIDADVYFYVADLITYSYGTNGGGSAMGHILLTYGVDGDGRVVDLTMHTVSK